MSEVWYWVTDALMLSSPELDMKRSDHVIRLSYGRDRDCKYYVIFLFDKTQIGLADADRPYFYGIGSVFLRVITCFIMNKLCINERVNKLTIFSSIYILQCIYKLE